jgi:putative endonuclease
MWNLYLIINGSYTYVGITNDLKKRIRQHNGEIKGGVKYTKDRGPYALIVFGLTKSSAYSFEYKVKHPLCKGYEKRHSRIIQIYEECDWGGTRLNVIEDKN